jgi:eukaryotic-like serine/threonine-protein kinase
VRGDFALLNSGTKLGPYEIVSPLGAGGMGEVYRARDTRLGRDVAIKVLPQQLTQNADAKQRFEREARAVSSLNHAHICTLHDIGHQDGTDFLVMEFIEGETLAKRLEKGPLATTELLRIAIEIADALEKAHRQGVIHRDLKPGNIMLTKSGAKLMDFGLAKSAIAGAGAAPPLSSLTQSLNPAGQSPTTPLTAAGTIVGTFQYMSPEQMEGKETDARSDIFSFGAVLFEMATGKRAFDGKTTASVIAAILEREPPSISSVQPMSPPALDRIVKICLAKDPDERFQSMHDVKLQLEWIRDAGSQAGVAAPVVAHRKNRERVAWAVATLLLIVAAAFATKYFLRTPAGTPVVRSFIRAAADTSMTSYNGGTAGFAISPDGLRVTYVALGPDGRSLLWVRPLDSLLAQPLDGTDGASMPFWSPDSQFIGFFAGGKLKKIEASGGPPLTLADAPGGRGGTWNRDGTILFTPFFGTPVYRVSDAGGLATPVTTLNREKDESTNRWPYFLPDGRHFLYLAGNPLTPVGNPTNSIVVGSLDSKETNFLFHNHSNAIYASGYLLFLRQNTLMAQAFDPKRLELKGDPMPIAEDVEDVATRVQASISASDNGTLAYLETGGTGRQLLWFDRSGKQIGTVLGTDSYADPHLSPDGKELAFLLEAPSQDVWVYDIARGVKTRFTFGSGNESPRWSPDGKRIAYTSIRNGEFGIYAKAADGSGHEEMLVPPGPEQIYPLDWSPDGRLLAYMGWELGTVAQSQLWILPLKDRKAYEFNLLQQNASPSARFSPDGKWLAYSSTESGKAEVYVTPFPGPGGKWQVSTDGGSFPVWRHDGKELFYMSLDDKIMAAEVSENGSSFEVGKVETLFQTRPYFGLFTANLFDVSADGQRFIIPYDSGQANRTISLVTNWPVLLKKQ